ncbi:MAG: hypothetical protein IKN43_00580 [Selenomonadaceae bacterium]|nr:hypothetical protein [Selenomonadaceae bacterium]
MFGVIMGLIGVLCLLLYFGMTAIEVLIKYSLLALRFIFWIIPLWIKAAAWFFYGWGWLLYHMTVNKQLLRQIRESEKLKNAYDYEYKQAWQREQDEFKLMIPVEKYPYADRELLNQSIEKLKEEAKLYTYDDVKDITPIRVRKRYGVTSDVRKIYDRYVIVVETDDGKDRILFQLKDHNDAICALSQMVGFITGRSGKFGILSVASYARGKENLFLSLGVCGRQD